MKNPKVSIFLPTVARFQQGHLARSIDSALAQTFDDFELLVVDDGSLDGTEAFLADLVARDCRVKHIRLPKNTGLPAYALAQAYPEATGDYFAWLFDDCELAQDHLETLLEALSANPQWGMVYARAQAQLTDDRFFTIGEPLDMAAMSKGANFIPNVCVLVPRTTIERVGWYDPHVILKRLCDWDLWLRIAQEFEVGFIDRTLATEHGVGLPGSLGRLYHCNRSLAVRYAQTDRNERLSPESIVPEDALRRELGFPLDDAEVAQLELSVFEHALLTFDHKLAMESVPRLRELGLFHDALERFTLQQGHPAKSRHDFLFIFTVQLMRQRLAYSAEAEIEDEVAVRAALEVAEQRMQSVLLLQGQLESSHSSNVALEAECQSCREQVQLMEAALAEETSRATLSQRVQEEVLHDLATVRHTLMIFRDAADQRLQLLNSANERAESLATLAESRLLEIERLQVRVQELEQPTRLAEEEPTELAEDVSPVGVRLAAE